MKDKQRLMLLVISSVMVSLFVNSAQVFAQTQTTVVGRVTDVDTKEVLSSVQVKIGNAKEVSRLPCS